MATNAPASGLHASVELVRGGAHHRPQRIPDLLHGRQGQHTRGSEHRHLRDGVGKQPQQRQAAADRERRGATLTPQPLGPD